MPRNTLSVALIAYTLGIAGFAAGSYLANERHLVYALDDAYVHMAMARNIPSEKSEVGRSRSQKTTTEYTEWFTEDTEKIEIGRPEA